MLSELSEEDTYVVKAEPALVVSCMTALGRARGQSYKRQHTRAGSALTYKAGIQGQQHDCYCGLLYEDLCSVYIVLHHIKP